MYQKILVPLDGSKLGETALPCIEELVSKLSPGSKVEVILLQVVSLLKHLFVAGEGLAEVPYTEQEMREIKKKAMDYLSKAGKGLKSKGAIVKTEVSTGDAADEINKYANEINADLVAMSTHGRSGLSRWAFGSVADKVLRGGSKPVLIVRTSCDEESR